MDIEYLKKYLNPTELDAGLEKLKKGIPVQYIVGNVDFYGNIIEVNSSVLIPRFETEGLVSKTAERLKNKMNLDIVDLGTGSGCVAISLKKLLNCNMDAVDISKEALSLAIKNASNNQTAINFYLGDMLKPLNKKYDCIISNPPYIGYDEEIMDLVKNNEPHLALFADNDGLAFYEQILRECLPYLKDNALIAFEIGHKQGDKVKKIALRYLECSVEIEKDDQGRDRYVFICLK